MTMDMEGFVASAILVLLLMFFGVLPGFIWGYRCGKQDARARSLKKLDEPEVTWVDDALELCPGVEGGMSTWQQEMGWNCDTCDRLNRGRYKKCQNCGKPKDREPFIDLPNEGIGLEFAVKNPELIQQATAGPDWECRFCSSHQRRDNGDCANCGARQGLSRDHKTRWDDGTEGPAGSGLTELEELQQESELEQQRVRLDALIDARRPSRVERDFFEAPSKPPPRPRYEYEPDPVLDNDVFVRRPWQKSWWSRQNTIVASVMLGVAFVGLLLFVLFRTRIVDAEVSAVQWAYNIHVDRYQIKRDEGFDETRPPDAFETQSVGMRHHHYDHVQDGTRQESYTEREACGTRTIRGSCRTTAPSCTSNGNGYKTCSGGGTVCSPDQTVTRYCTVTKQRTVPTYKDVSRERMWYRWKVWRWVPNRTVGERGSDLKPFWPTAEKVGLNKNLGPEAKRERTRRETLFLTTFIDEDGETHGYRPKSLVEFRSLPVGTKKRLKVSIAGSPEVMPEEAR